MCISMRTDSYQVLTNKKVYFSFMLVKTEQRYWIELQS